MVSSIFTCKIDEENNSDAFKRVPDLFRLFSYQKHINKQLGPSNHIMNQIDLFIYVWSFIIVLIFACRLGNTAQQNKSSTPCRRKHGP